MGVDATLSDGCRIWYLNSVREVKYAIPIPTPGLFQDFMDAYIRPLDSSH